MLYRRSEQVRQEVSDQSQLPLGSILYQLANANIHYPRSKTWSEEVLTDLKDYSVAEDKQGGLQAIYSWKDVVHDAISTLTQENDLGVWTWDENHYLGHIKMFPKLLRSVYIDQWVRGLWRGTIF
jgi:hypothetical protein